MPYTYPNIGPKNRIEEIETHLLPKRACDDLNFEDDDVKKMIKKFSLLADRLEFISNLDILAKDIETITDKKDRFGEITEKPPFVFDSTYLKNDFAGVHLDIDALRIYLLISCIDTLAGQVPFVKFSDFLLRKMEEDKKDTLTSADINSYNTEYEGTFGLSKNFRNQFVKILDSKLRDKWIDNFAVYATIGAKEGNAEKINKERLKSWEQKANGEKMRSLANKLFDMRSKFTHGSIRAFNLTENIEMASSDHKSHIVRLKDVMLDVMLDETIKALAITQFEEAKI